MKQRIVILLVLVAATPSLASNDAQIIDQGESVDVEKVAELVCDITKGVDKQIGRTATVSILLKFLKTLPAEHKLARCRDQIGEFLERLQQVLETGNGNVCGNEKVTKIEQFHRRYLSEVKKYKQEREANNWMAPELGKLLFIHYAHRISSSCEQRAALELGQVAGKMEAVEEGKTSSKEIDKLVGQMSEVLGVSDLSRGYDNVFLLWNLLDKLPVEKSEKFSRYLSTGGDPRPKLTLAVHQANSLRQIQDQCATVMRPIYTRSLLGVMRLVDLGYYPEREFLIKEVREMPASRRLFVMAQVCEILRPIRVMEDTTLMPEQIVMIPKDEQVEEANSREILNPDEEYVEVADDLGKNLENLELTDKENAKSVAKKLKKTIQRRDESTKLIFKSMINSFKAKIKSKIDCMLMAAGGTVRPALDKNLTVNERDLAGLIEEESEQCGTSLGREKRSCLCKALSKIAYTITFLIKAALTLVVGVIYFVIYLTLVYGLDAFRVLYFDLTGIQIKWIRDFVRGYSAPLVWGVQYYREKVAKNED